MRAWIIAATTGAVTQLACAGAARAQAEPPAEADVIPVSDAAAPEPAPANPPPRSQPVLEQIVVTAQRREENLQEVPISITVFDQEDLSKANVVNAADLATYTPSLTTNSRFGNENASFAIRGFTQDLRTTASVAVYFAEVVAPRGQSLQTSGDGAGPGAFFDLQNVQVLKGPQGTLFGRNTTGGAVLIVPQKPKDELGGFIEATAGDFDARRLQAVINVPVAESFRLRLGVDHNERDGYLRNIAGIGADHLGNVNYTAARLSAVWDVTDDVENYTILTYLDSDTYGSTAQLFACNPSPLPLENPLFAITGNACQTQLDQQEAAGQNGFYDLVSTVATPVTRIKEKRAINTTTWNVGESLTFKNILAYADLYTVNSSEIFGTRFHAIYDPNPDRMIKVGLTVANPDIPVTNQNTLVEELQLLGNAFEDRFEWQAGAYYEHSKPDGASGNNSATLLSCDPASLEGDPSGYDCVDALAGAVGSVRTYAFKTDYLNRAVYAQATYDVVEQVSVTAGLRQTWDRTKGSGLLTRYGFAGPVPLPPTTIESDPRTKSEAVTGVLNVDYRPFDDVMLYAKYARGYRQGSVNMASDPGLQIFDPEQVDTYEVGAKTTFGGWVPGRFNFAAFYNDFKDMQLQTGYVSTDIGSTTAIFNAGKARIVGGEIEAYFQLLETLSLSLSYSKLDTELLEQEDHTSEILLAAGPVAALTVTPIADEGDTLPFAPDHAGVATLNYRLPIWDSLGEMSLSGTYVYIGKQRATATSASPFDELDAYSLLNLNFGWTRMFGSSFDLAFFATNVLEEKYVTYTSGTYGAVGFDSRNVGLPRMWGARLRYTF